MQPRSGLVLDCLQERIRRIQAACTPLATTEFRPPAPTLSRTHALANARALRKGCMRPYGRGCTSAEVHTQTHESRTRGHTRSNQRTQAHMRAHALAQGVRTHMYTYACLQMCLYMYMCVEKHVYDHAPNTRAHTCADPHA
eukprot:4331145-Pleurochrysis_carterae.AAC.3